MWWKIISLWDFHVVPGNLSGVRQAFSLMLDCHLIIILPNILSGISFYPSDKPSPWCWIIISWSVDSQIFTQYFIWNIRQPFSLMLDYHLMKCWFFDFYPIFYLEYLFIHQTTLLPDVDQSNYKRSRIKSSQIQSNQIIISHIISSSSPMEFNVLSQHVELHGTADVNFVIKIKSLKADLLES